MLDVESDIVKYELGQSIHCPSVLDCSVWISAKWSTRSRQAREKLSRPNDSISRFESNPSVFSTSTSTQSPWQSKPFWNR